MKTVTILSLFLLTSAAFGELTKEDLHDLKEDLRKVIKEEIAASEKRTREYIDLKVDAVNTRIDAVDKSLGRVWLMIAALIGLITATIAIPQIITAYRDRGQKEMQLQIDQLREKIEAMNQ